MNESGLKGSDFKVGDYVEIAHAKPEYKGVQGMVTDVAGPYKESIITIDACVRGPRSMTLEELKKSSLGFYAWRLEKIGSDMMKICVICYEKRSDRSNNFCTKHREAWDKWVDVLGEDLASVKEFAERGAPEPPSLCRVDSDKLDDLIDVLEEVGYEINSDGYIQPKKAGENDNKAEPEEVPFT